MEISFIHGIIIFVAALFGEAFGCMFGGGSFFVQPVLLAVGISAKMTVANDIASAAFACVGFLLTTKNRSKEITQTAIIAAPTLILGAIIGGHVLKTIPAQLVEILILLICTVGFIYVMTHFRKKKDIATKVKDAPIPHWKLALMAAGLLIGFYDGVSGAGSGIIIIAVMAMIVRKDMNTTICMSNWVSCISLTAAGLTFLFLGLLDFKLLALMIPAAFLAGVVAARLNDLLPERLLRIIYAGVLIGLLIYLAAGTLQDYGIF